VLRNLSGLGAAASCSYSTRHTVNVSDGVSWGAIAHDTKRSFNEIGASSFIWGQITALECWRNHESDMNRRRRAELLLVVCFEVLRLWK
jgi:hypothetical protein